MRYGIINDKDVYMTIRKQAHFALAFCRKEFSLPMVNIKFFTSVYRNPLQIVFEEYFDNDSDNILGLFRAREPFTILVNAYQLPDEIQNTVLHETAHLATLKSKLAWGKIEKIDDERLTQDYADRAMERMGPYSIDNDVYWEHLCGKDWSLKPAPVANEAWAARVGPAPVKSKPLNSEQVKRAAFDRYIACSRRAHANGYW